MVIEVDVENVNAELGKEYVYTIEHEINDVNLSQDGCVEREDGLVMIDSGASGQRVSQRVWDLQTGNSLMVQLVSEVQTENRSKNTERDRSG